VEKRNPDMAVAIKRDYANKPAREPEKDIMVQRYRLLEEKTNLKPGNDIHEHMADLF
jgi:hypothetical protein